jgi:GDP-4-dehydro-6-deoxy-D-mannose reductase
MRPFNHIGPGQNNRFAAADWAMQIARIERGLQEPLVKVGNLSAARDFTDVRDVVRAYVVAAERGVAGDVFNVCSGQPQTMQHILDVLISMSTRPITVKVDPERFRPVDIPSLYGSYAQLQARTGWQPQLSLEQSLQEALDDCRRKLLAQ